MLQVGYPDIALPIVEGEVPLLPAPRAGWPDAAGAREGHHLPQMLVHVTLHHQTDAAIGLVHPEEREPGAVAWPQGPWAYLTPASRTLSTSLQLGLPAACIQEQQREADHTEGSEGGA